MRYLSLFLLGLLMACYSPKYTGSFDGLEEMASFSRGACFGTCPVFTLTLYKNGVAQYKGARNVVHLGTHYATLSKTDFKAIKKSIKTIKLQQYEDRYRADVTDLPTASISIMNKGKKKTVSGNGNFPEAVVALQTELDALIGRQDWTKVE